MQLQATFSSIPKGAWLIIMSTYMDYLSDFPESNKGLGSSQCQLIWSIVKLLQILELIRMLLFVLSCFSFLIINDSLQHSCTACKEINKMLQVMQFIFT
jgi:hypothetical protein